jgi:hypothetical protein
MNPQTYDDIKAEVVKRLGNRQDLATRIDQWAMDAFTELTQAPKASFRELDALYTIVAKAEIPRIEVPGDFWFILSLRDPERKLDQVHWQVLDKIYRTRGIPMRFARYENYLELDPIPDSDRNLTMRYRRRLPQLQSGMPIPLEREWHEILTTLTVSKGLWALQRYEEYNGIKQGIEGELGNRQDNPLLEDDGYETTIGVRFS